MAELVVLPYVLNSRCLHLFIARIKYNLPPEIRKEAVIWFLVHLFEIISSTYLSSKNRYISTLIHENALKPTNKTAWPTVEKERIQLLNPKDGAKKLEGSSRFTNALR